MENSGIIARTYDDEEYYFYTEIQSDVENAMILMGYNTHGYCLGMFKDRPEPETDLSSLLNGYAKMYCRYCKVESELSRQTREVGKKGAKNETSDICSQPVYRTGGLL